MFSEVLKIKPQVDGAGLATMEKNLNGRFTKVAKKFGAGMVNALKTGAIFGAVTSLIDKILNPFEEVRAAIEKSLSKGDDLATYAKQFNTTAGNLARLQAYGKATGLDPEGVRLLLGKFQGKVAEATADPSKSSAVSAFVGRSDTADAFFEFIQSVQKLDATQQNLVQQEVFGEKQILKASEFLNANFKELALAFRSAGTAGTSEVTQRAEWLAGLSDRKDLATAVMEYNDIVTKAKGIGNKSIDLLLKSDRLDLKQENKGVKDAAGLAALSIENQKLMNTALNEFIRLAPALATAIPATTSKVEEGVDYLRGLGYSRMVKGMVKDLTGRGK